MSDVLKDGFSTSYNPTLCVTHRCNLSCIYCYQKMKDSSSMTFDIAKKCIDDIFANIPEGTKIIEISFIGGEPLLETALIKAVFEYTLDKYSDERLHFFATTNGVALSEEDKRWFSEHKNKFVLGLSLDGTKETHDFNRSNSFSKIDIDYFAKTWPEQGPKMTISKKTLHSLAKDIMFIHSLGFTTINGVNFAEGDFDWGDKDELLILSQQLRLLLEYYTEHFERKLDQMFGKHIEFCASNDKRKARSCGIGKNSTFYDVDGKKYPCSFITPMTFSAQEIENIKKTDFENVDEFIDIQCFNECYLFPVCGTCSGANYLVNHSFSQRIKSRCSMMKLIALYVAELHTRRIIEHRDLYTDDNQLYYLIDAIKGIKKHFYSEFCDILLHSQKA